MHALALSRVVSTDGLLASMHGMSRCASRGGLVAPAGFLCPGLTRSKMYGSSYQGLTSTVVEDVFCALRFVVGRGFFSSYFGGHVHRF
jgi:hypothetical protein